MDKQKRPQEGLLSDVDEPGTSNGQSPTPRSSLARFPLREKKGRTPRVQKRTIWKCSFPGCKKSVSASRKRVHLRTHCKSEEEISKLMAPPVVVKPNPCELPGCVETYGTKSTMRRHMKMVHYNGGVIPKQPKSLRSLPASLQPSSVKKTVNPTYRCPYPGCTLRPRGGRNMRRHYCTHFEGRVIPAGTILPGQVRKEKTIACIFPGCLKKFTTVSGMKGHLKGHYEGGVLPALSPLEQEIKRMNPPRKYQRERAPGVEYRPLSPYQLLMRKLGRCTTCKLQGPNAFCHPTHHGVMTDLQPALGKKKATNNLFYRGFATKSATGAISTVDLSRLGEALQRQWTSNADFDHVKRLQTSIANQKLPEAMLVTVDVEFSSVSRKIFEIGITTINSGEVLFNSRIQHDCSNEVLISPKGSTLSLTQKQKFLGFATLESVYGNNRSKCTGLQNVHQVAAKLQEAGLTAETTILSWHQSYTDLVLLREFLQSGGYDDVLPPNERCVRMIPQYRHHLPRSSTGKRFSARLDVLFPILFAGHELVGRNHHALQEYLTVGQASHTSLQKWLGSGITVAVDIAKVGTEPVKEASDKTESSTVDKETAIITWEDGDESETEDEGAEIWASTFEYEDENEGGGSYNKHKGESKDKEGGNNYLSSQYDSR
jgi:hypothetical protein